MKESSVVASWDIMYIYLDIEESLLGFQCQYETRVTVPYMCAAHEQFALCTGG